MDGWMDKEMGVDGGMEREMEGWMMEGWSSGRMDGWREMWRDGWMMDGWRGWRKTG